jgi:CRISPR-associated endonuclease Csn1
MRYTLGLDIGITSVGWCVINEEEPAGIVDLGVRTFPAAENPKDGSSLALARRLARGGRRRLSRRKKRLQDIRQLLVTHGLVKDLNELNDLLTTPHSTTPYELRAAGLDRLLSSDEWCRALLHIAKRRGFKSNRKSDAEGTSDKAKTEGVLLQSVAANRERLANYRTVGEMMQKAPYFADHKRNREGDYASTVARSMLLDEIRQLFDAQRRTGNPQTSVRLEKEYTELFAFQFPFASGDQIEKMTGNCTLLPEFKRAPAMGWTSEYFKLLSRVLTLRLTGRGRDEALDAEQREKLVNLAFKTSKLSWAQVRSALEIDKDLTFRGIRYGREQDKSGKAENVTFVELKGYHSLRRAVGKVLGKEAWQSLAGTPSQMDLIAWALTFYKSDEEICAFLSEAGVQENIIKAVLPVSLRGVMKLSTEAMRRLIPYMEKGDGYDVACKKAGLSHYDTQGSAERVAKLPPLNLEEETLRNPVVIRALSQTRKVVNAIVDHYGSPTWINIELARDLSRPFDERKKIQKEQDENRKEREQTAGQIETTFKFSNPAGGDILKYRLWKEQQGKCAYSQTPIEAIRLFETGYAEVDHILPYSRSMDNSYGNKILVLSSENRNKKNFTPYEYLGSMPERWDAFQDWVTATIRNATKRNRLLRQEMTREDADEMTERNLTDTRYITRFAANWLRRRLKFADETIKTPVLCVNGRMTAQLRGRWGLEKKREAGDSHHALDAAVVAAAATSMVKKISEYSKRKELYQNRTAGEERKEHFPEPWPGFRNELLARLSPDLLNLIEEKKIAFPNYTPETLAGLRPLFVSRAPRRKARGAAHQETIRSFRERGPEEKWQLGTVLRTSIRSLNFKNLEDMVGKDRDVRLYEALKERLQAFAGKGENAFAEPFHKPTRDGSQGPLVRTVKLYTPGASGIPVRGGRANNGEMIRVDVYAKGGKFFLVPHYVDDIAKKRIKKRAIIPGKLESQWTPIDDSFEFRFSLFKNDLVRVENKKEILFGYYAGTHRVTGSIGILAHDGSKEWQGVGVKTCLSFEKYHVDVLGHYYKIAREKPPMGRDQ